MPSIRKLYDDAAAELALAGIEKREASLNSAALLEYVFGYDRNYLYAHGEREADEDRLSLFMELCEKRKRRIPLQHLTHSQCFMGLEFYVDENVLIPRPDTELLVEEAMLCVSDGARVLDLCAGSGCILISLMKYTNGIEGVFSDISKPALSVCERNAKEHGVFEGASFIESDLFNGIPDTEKFDAVLSNPPYIRSGEIGLLEPEVRDHDPRIALDGHEDGLYFYRRIASEAMGHLKLSGCLLLEIGYDQGEAVGKLLEKAGFTGIEIKKDYSGNDRVVKARRPV